MTQVDASAAGQNLQTNVANFVSFFAYASSSTDDYGWTTSFFPGDGREGNHVHTFGSGITIDSSTKQPTGGMINRVEINVDNSSISGLDATIDLVIIPDRPIALTALVRPASTDTSIASDIFWSALLSGNDTIVGSGFTSFSFLFGDFFEVGHHGRTGDIRTGGDDTLSVYNQSYGGESTLVGDAYRVTGFVSMNIVYQGELHGGNDLMTLTGIGGYTLIGDADRTTDLGAVFGGNDTIFADVNDSGFSDLSQTVLIGDVYRNVGATTGGADRITGADFVFARERIAGDARESEGFVQGGADTIDGRGGSEVISGDVEVIYDGMVIGGADRVRGGEDSDVIAGDVYAIVPFLPGGDEVFELTGGSDLIYGDGGADTIAGDLLRLSTDHETTVHGGNDTLFGGDGADRLFGDVMTVSTDARLTLTGGRDSIDGGAGNDRIDGGLGNDTLMGGTGDDRIDPGADRDTVDGGAGADTVASGLGADAMTGGTETDTLDYGASSAAVNVNLATGMGTGGDAEGDRFSGFEVILGSNSSDRLTGDAGVNTLSGGAGNDILDGGAGNDTLDGGDGKDVLTGGAGHDMMTGGLLADRFVILARTDSSPGTNRDVLADFSHAQADRIDLSAIDANNKTSANDAFAFIGASAFGHHAGELRFAYSGSAVTIVEADIDGNGTADLQIELTGHIALVAGDFAL